MLMSKVSAIYSALDHGNAKSALKLCQQALAKSANQPLVSALMALALSRLDLGDQAIALCNELLKQGEKDPAVIETIGYVFRREDRFDLLHAMFSEAIAIGPSNDLLVETYMAGIQGNIYDSLSSIAMKLFKETGDKKYCAWSALGLVLNNSDERSISLAIAMLDKAMQGARGPNPQGQSRETTSGRFFVYLALFKLQLLVKIEKWSDACNLIDDMSSSSTTLVSDRDSSLLKRDLDSLRGLSPLNVVDRTKNEMDRIIFSDTDGNWSDGTAYQEFFQNFKSRIHETHSRSDCLVALAPYLALVQREDISEIASTVLNLLEETKRADSSSPISLVNLFKLLYALHVSAVQVSEILIISSRMCEKENCTDECSPGKQLMLLAAIVLLESSSCLSTSFPALALLEKGSSEFPHCSHFRLVQCIAYFRFGLPRQGIDRFEALGIKNAQWRNLWWLIHPAVVKGMIHSEKKDELLNNARSFFARNKRELLQNLETLVEENLFYKFNDFRREIQQSENSGVKQFVETEMELDKILAGFHSATDFPAQMQGVRDEADYSPLLFIAMPKIESENTTTFRRKTERRDTKTRSRACGFRWDHSFFNEPEILPGIPLSAERVLGKWIRPVAEESWDFQQERIKVIRAINAFPKSEFILPEMSNGPYRPCCELLRYVRDWKAGISVSDCDFDTIHQNFASLVPEKETADANDIFGEFRNLGEPVEASIRIIEKALPEFSKKSAERKMLKRVSHALKQQLEDISVLIKGKDCRFPDSPESSLEQGFLKTLRQYIEEERAELIERMSKLSHRIQELKL